MTTQHPTTQPMGPSSSPNYISLTTPTDTQCPNQTNTMIETTLTKSRCNECLSSLQAMLTREEKSYACSPSADSDYLEIRRSLVDVFDEVFALCQLQNRDTVAVAISYLDRFVSMQKRRFVNLQIAAMTCFYLAVKLYEPTVIPPHMIVELFQRALDCEEDEVDDDASTDTVMSAESIESMEMTILSALNWNLNPPTAMMFVRQILSCLPNTNNLGQWKQTALDLSQAILRVAVKSNDVIGIKASTQAVAALFLAVEKLPVSSRAAVYKFLLKAARMTGAEQQRQVLAVQGLLKRLVSQAFEDVATTPEVPAKRPALVEEETDYDRPAKKQRIVGEVSFTSSPRSTLFPPTVQA